MTHPADATAQPFRPTLLAPGDIRADRMSHFQYKRAAARNALRKARLARSLGRPDLAQYFATDARHYRHAAIEWLRMAREIAA